MLKAVGMGSLTYLSLEDQSMLCMIEKYVKFRQGELWRQIKEEFEVEVRAGCQPGRGRAGFSQKKEVLPEGKSLGG